HPRGAPLLLLTWCLGSQVASSTATTPLCRSHATRAVMGLIGVGFVSLLSAAPPPSETLATVGFSEDGGYFAFVLAAPGKSEGPLLLYQIGNDYPERTEELLKLTAPIKDGGAEPSAEVMAALKLGSDPGEQRYKSGGARRT